jgi:hypothetical protein
LTGCCIQAEEAVGLGVITGIVCDVKFAASMSSFHPRVSITGKKRKKNNFPLEPPKFLK